MRIWLTHITSFRASHRLEIREDEDPLADVSGLVSLGKEDLRLWWHLAFKSLTMGGLFFCQLPQLFPSLPYSRCLAAVAISGYFSSICSGPVQLLPFSKTVSVL